MASTIANQNEDEDTIISIPFQVTDSNGGILFVSAESDNLTLFSPYNLLICDPNSQETTQIITTSAGNPKWLTFTLIPESDQSGVAGITLTVTDNEGLTHMQNFSVTINPVDDAPKISL